MVLVNFISQHKLLTLLNHLQHKLGLEPKLARKVVQSLREYFLIQLSSGEDLIIRGLGKFKLRAGSRRRIVYTASEEVYKLLTSLEKTGKMRVPVSDLEKIVVARLKQKTAKIEQETSFVLAKRDYSQVQTSLLLYLYRDFKYQLPWKHPATRVEYSHADIIKALLILKEFDPQGYLIVWILWVSVKSRSRLAKRLSLNYEQLYTKWLKAVDTLLLVIAYPQLTPTNLDLLVQPTNL